MKALKLTLFIFGIVIISISVTHVLVGPTWMPDVDNVSASTDSQHRFYTALFSSFGVALIWASRDLLARAWIVRWVAAAFLFGGLGRLLSLWVMGIPHHLFVGLMLIELAAPILILFWSGQVLGKPAGR